MPNCDTKMKIKSRDSFLPYGEAIWGKKLDFGQEGNVRFLGGSWRVHFNALNCGILFRIKEKRRHLSTDFTPRTYQS